MNCIIFYKKSYMFKENYRIFKDMHLICCFHLELEFLSNMIFSISFLELLNTLIKWVHSNHQVRRFCNARNCQRDYQA